jgi:hypothetical protein
MNDVLAMLVEHHRNLHEVCSKSASETRDLISKMEADQSLRPSFAQGDKWEATKKLNLSKADWDEQKAAEHLEYLTFLESLR